MPALSPLPPGHPPVAPARIGVLIINLGTPEATSYWPMRRYLKEFLSDRRVIETNRALWWVILNGIILTTRPKRSGHAYDKIWNRDLDESPLKTITRSQARKLAAALGGALPGEAGWESAPVLVDWAMRYGLPPIADRLAALKQAGCERILLFPLYPQYSATTTASVLDKAYEALQTMRWQPAIRTVPPYFDDPAHIAALARSLETALKGLAWQPDRILMSFHGLPKDYWMKGDPYHCHCLKTARLVREKMGLSEDRLQVVFQSRFGKAEWLQPYAQEVVEALPGQGVKNLLMITPGFAADCVETLEEVAIGLGETFREHGGENFAVVPSLNDTSESIHMLETIVRRELMGWR